MMNVIPNPNGGEDVILLQVPAGAVENINRKGRWVLRFHPDGLYIQEPDTGIETKIGDIVSGGERPATKVFRALNFT